MKFLKNKIIITITSVIFLQIILFIPIKTNAVVPVIDLPNLSANTTTATLLGSLEIKEYTLDPTLGYAMAKIAINVLTESVVNWINSGFQGGPAFVTDLRGFLLDIADAETALFIEGTALEALCSPWSLNIRIALDAQRARPFEREVACTLSDIVANMDDFINGNFSQGGWAGWFELTTKPQNNPYGLYLMTSSELDQRITGVQQRESQLLDWGNGFMSYKECDDGPYEGPNPVGGGPGAPQDCKIVTPGSVIEDQLELVLGSGVRQLELADEFNEIVNALLNQLINQALGGLGGLRGASRSYYGRSPITTQIGGSSSGSSLLDIKEHAVVGIKNDINNETNYRDIKQNTLNTVTASENLLFKLQACYAGKLAGNLNSTYKATAQDRINNAGSVIADKITSNKTLLENDIKLANKNIEKLNNFINQINNASDKEEVGVIANDLVLMRLSGELNTSDIYTAQTEQATITAQMSSLDSTTNTQIKECQEFPPKLNNQSGNN